MDNSKPVLQHFDFPDTYTLANQPHGIYPLGHTLEVWDAAGSDRTVFVIE